MYPFLKLNVQNKWISFEPLLGNINIEGLTKKQCQWAVIGCESGNKRRECKLEWIENLVLQLKKAKIPVWVKQISIDGKVIDDINQFPEYLRIREFPVNKTL